jgi:ABC-type uncharacterized transport system substrate-binding protein
MKTTQIISTISLAIFAVLIFQLCSTKKGDKKIITYINSFHRGHPSSDDIMDGILEGLPADSFEIDTYFMDTKRNPSQEHILQIASQLFDTIKSKNPDKVKKTFEINIKSGLEIIKDTYSKLLKVPFE